MSAAKSLENPPAPQPGELEFAPAEPGKTKGQPTPALIEPPLSEEEDVYFAFDA